MESFLIICIYMLGYPISILGNEFRFCYKGLQSVDYTDCQYGIYFPKAINSSCIVHLPESGSTSQKGGAVYVRLVSSLCDEDNPQESEMTPGEIYPNISFQHVNFVRTRSRAGANAGGFAGTGNECIAECEAETQVAYQNEIETENEDNSDPYEIPPPTPEIIEEQKPLGQNFMRYLLGLADGTAKALQLDENTMKDTTKDLRLLKLFRLTVQIIQANCQNPWVRTRYWDKIYYAFKWMFTKFVPSDFMDIGLEQYKGIKVILKTCLGSKRPYELVGENCSGNSVQIVSINFTNSDGTSASIRYRPKAHSYRWLKYDIFMESAWAAVDFVHGFCFSSFAPDYNLEHIFFDGMEGLFIPGIQRRWLYYRGIREEFYWDFVAGVANMKLVMRNIDVCVEASYLKSPYIHRLERPFFRPKTLLSTTPVHKAENDSVNIDDTTTWCATSRQQKEQLIQDSSSNCRLRGEL